MTSGRLAIGLLCALTAFAGIGTAFAVTGDDGPSNTPGAIELRKDDAQADVFVEEDDGDFDDTKGDDGTSGGDNTGDGDSTRGNDGTRGGDNTGDGDATDGNDGTSGGDNSYVAPAPVYEAPVYDDSAGGYGGDT